MTANRNGAGADGLASFKTNRIIDIAGPEKPPAMNHPCARWQGAVEKFFLQFL